MTFIKLTRLDNSPIWLNAALIVTVEPRRGGGAVVVPMGDGLDYDVRETPEQVLALLQGPSPALTAVPEPQIVPVPAPHLLAPTPADVSPDPAEKPAEQSAEKLTEKPAEKQAQKPSKRKRSRRFYKPAASPKPITNA